MKLQTAVCSFPWKNLMLKVSNRSIISDKTPHTNKGRFYRYTFDINFVMSLHVMYHRPFNRSMGLWIINEFLNDIEALIKNTLTDWYIISLTEACKRYSLQALLGSTHGLFTSESCCRLARHDRYITYNKIIKNCWIIRGFNTLYM